MNARPPGQNATKPKITAEIEGSAAMLTAEQTANILFKSPCALALCIETRATVAG